MKKIITICLVTAVILAAGTQALATGTYADLTSRANYKASTGLSLGDWGPEWGGSEGYAISADFQINLLYQDGILDSDIDGINDYWDYMNNTYGAGWEYNFGDNEEYVLNINAAGGLTIYGYPDGQVTGGTDIKWTLTGWAQTILAGDIIDNGDGTLFLEVLPAATYRPFEADPPVNNVEVFSGLVACEVLGYTFTGTIGDIGTGDSLGIVLVPEPATICLIGLGGLFIRKKTRA